MNHFPPRYRFVTFAILFACAGLAGCSPFTPRPAAVTGPAAAPAQETPSGVRNQGYDPPDHPGRPALPAPPFTGIEAPATPVAIPSETASAGTRWPFRAWKELPEPKDPSLRFRGWAQ